MCPIVTPQSPLQKKLNSSRNSVQTLHRLLGVSNNRECMLLHCTASVAVFSVVVAAWHGLRSCAIMVLPCLVVAAGAAANLLPRTVVAACLLRVVAAVASSIVLGV